MTLDPSAVGRATEPRVVTWDADDTCGYALGVGAGVDELAWTTDNTSGVDHQALPTMTTVLGADLSLLAMIGDVDWTNLVHSDQSIEVPVPLAPSGAARVTTTLVELWDKRRAAVAVLETVGVHIGTGEVLFRTRASLHLGGAGGWGGERGPTTRTPTPSDPPAATVVLDTYPDQALRYRLTGDHNPLHTDPAAAAAAGFDRPILHGLCTFGFTGRALIHARGDGDASRLTSMRGRFAAPVFPGDRLQVDVWDLGADEVAFRTRRDQDVVLSGGRATIRRPEPSQDGAEQSGRTARPARCSAPS